LDGHVAVLKHTLNGDGVAFLLDVSSVGDLRDAELLRDLGAYLRGVAVDCLAAAEYDIVILKADLFDRSGEDLGGSKGVRTAELTGGYQDSLIRAHCKQLAQHALCR